MERAAYTIAQLVHRGLGSRSKIYEEIRNGKLRARKRGRSTIVLPKDEQAYLNSLPVIEPKATAEPEPRGQQHGQHRRRSK